MAINQAPQRSARVGMRKQFLYRFKPKLPLRAAGGGYAATGISLIINVLHSDRRKMLFGIQTVYDKGGIKQFSALKPVASAGGSEYE
jgi:hypothetical protein